MSAAACKEPECNRPTHRRGWCNACYQRGRKAGTIQNAPRLTEEERFWQKVIEQPDGCWMWQSARSDTGYGTFSVKGANGWMSVYAHRYAYETMVDEIPNGLHIDHLCRNPLCVNPWHLDPVTSAVNVLRGNSPSVIRWRERRCIRGHALDSENTLIMATDGRRVCRACHHYRYLRSIGRVA